VRCVSPFCLFFSVSYWSGTMFLPLVFLGLLIGSLRAVVGHGSCFSIPLVLIRILFPTVGNRTRRRTGRIQQKIIQYARDCLYSVEKVNSWWWAPWSLKHVEWRTTNREIKDSPKVSSCWCLFWNNCNDARNHECKICQFRVLHGPGAGYN